MPFDQDNIEQLIVQKLTGNISAEENEELLRLLRDDESAKQLWDELNEAHEIFSGGVFAESVHEKEAWEKVHGQLNISETVITKNTPAEATSPSRKRSLIMAAIFFLIAAGGSFYFFSAKPKTAVPPFDGVVLKMSNGKIIDIPHGQENFTIDKNTGASITLANGNVLADATKESINKQELNSLFVPEGKDYHMVLSDGTEVWLNAATEFRFPLTFTGNTRTVSIKGEGFFKVAPGSNKPFIVKTHEMDIKVLGTEFNVKCYSDEPSKTSLVNGKVMVQSPGGRDTTLIPGKEAEVAENGRFHINDFEEDTTLSWMRGIYIFSNQDLHHLQSIIKRWYNMEVVISEEGVGKKRFTGTVQKNKPLEEFLNSLTKSSDVQFHFKDKQVVFHYK